MADNQPNNFRAMALRKMTCADFLTLGADKIVFVKPIEYAGVRTYGVYSASGEELGTADSFELAEATAFRNDFAVATLH